MVRRFVYPVLLVTALLLTIPGFATAGSPSISPFSGIKTQNPCLLETVVLNGYASAQVNLSGATPFLNIQVPGTITAGSGATNNFLVNASFAVPSQLNTAFDMTSPVSGIDPALNTVVSMKIHIAIQSLNIVSLWVDNFVIKCRRSPIEEVSFARGFGDQRNKYAWSMKDFSGYMYVGTNNVSFRLFDAIANGLLTTCPITAEEPYVALYCMAPYSDYNGSEIWRYSYTTRNWEKVFDNPDPTDMRTWSQGFREMEVYDGQLYVSNSTLGGVTQFLRTTDGVVWTPVPGGPGYPGTPTYAPGTTSMRTMAVFNGKLYTGTDNNNGAQFWSFDNVNGWTLIKTFDATSAFELTVFNNKLYLAVGGEKTGLGWQVYEYAGNSTLTPVRPTIIRGAAPWQPTVDLTKLHNLGVCRMYTYNGKLYVGTANYIEGFTLLTLDRYGNWRVVTANGFGYTRNTYAWSFTNYKGRLFLGTFNSLTFEVPLVLLDMLTGNDMGFGAPIPPAQDLYRNIKVTPDPRSQLWMSEDGLHWVQVALPLRWNFWDYGIRNLEVGNNSLFIGTASNAVAPELPEAWAPFFGAGTSVWKIGTVPPGSEIIGTWPR